MRNRPQTGDSYDSVALVLQGGGALGAYQVGVYRALEELGLYPDWVAGNAIGAANAAIIAGNPPEERVRRLEEFWGSISYPMWWPWPGTDARSAHDTLSTLRTVVLGNPGFSRLRPVNPWLARPGAEDGASYYDPAPLRSAVERFVDFDRIRAGGTRLSVGAVNVRTGQLRYFDSAHEAIGLEHVLASMATPPAFPPVEIDGELYWHGGVVSNTPLNAVLDANPRADTLCVMVDLFSPDGPAPSGMKEVMGRLDEIGYASRTDTSLAHFQENHDMRRIIAALIDELPIDARRRPDIQAMAQLGRTSTMNIVRLAYRPAGLEFLSGEFDYSRLSTEDHMRAGYEDATAGCSGAARFTTPLATPLPAGVFIHDPRKPTRRAQGGSTMSGTKTSLTGPFRVLGEATVPGGTLRVAFAGPPPDEADAVVLAVHGITSSLMAWRTIARDLAGRTGVCLLAPDLRGRGQSAALPGPYGMAVHVADMLAVLDHVGVERAVLAGHSMGAHVVSLLAAQHPGRAAAVVLLDAGLPIAVPPDMDADQAYEYAVEQSVSRLRVTYPSVEEYVGLWRAHPALRDEWNDDLEAYARYDLTGSPGAMRSVITEEAVAADCRDLVYSETTRTAVDQVRAPLHLVLAPRGLLDADPVIPRPVVEAFAAGHPEARIEEIPDVNHYTLVLGGGPGPRRVAAVIEEAIQRAVTV